MTESLDTDRQAIRLWIVATSTLLLGAALVAGGGMAATDPGDNLTVVGSTVSGDRVDTLLTATVRNNSGSDYRDVRLGIDFLDDRGRIVGNTVVRTAEVRAGEEWRFTAPVAARATRAVVHGRDGRRYAIREELPLDGPPF